MLRARAVLWGLAAYALLAERLVVPLDTGGRGLLPVLMVVTPVVILGVVPLSHRGFRFLRNGDFWLYWGLYILLSCVLPILGVLIYGYPLRSLFGALAGGLPLVFISVGHWIAAGPPERAALFRRLLAFLVVVQVLFAAGQYLYVHCHAEGWALAPLSKWDRSIQALYGEAYVIQGRSIGTYVNPNVLGIWAVMGFWAAALLLRGTQGTCCAILSLLTLVLSQSRGAMGTMAVTISAFAFTRIANTLVGNMKVRVGTVSKVLAIMVALVLSMPTMSGIVPGADRIASAVRSVFTGPGVDVNLGARVLVWGEALALHRAMPWGTFGPPELVFGKSIDSEWVRLLLQGGVPLICAFVLSLMGGLRHVTYRKAENSFLAMASMGLAVLSVTSTPMGSPPIALYWVGVGWCLAGRRQGSGRALQAEPSGQLGGACPALGRKRG